MHYFDRATIDCILSADPASIERTLTKDRWGELHGPAHEEWALYDESTQILCRAVHYWRQRHPEALADAIGIASTMIVIHTTGMDAGFGQDQDPRYEEALAWISAFAGGQPPAPGEMFGLTPPLDAAGRPMLPGGDAASWTRAAIEVLDRLLFRSRAEARVVIEDYLALHREDGLADRAARIYELVRQWQFTSPSEIRCFDCAAGGLDHWYTSRDGGYSLCAPCFETRQRRGLAKESS